MTDRGGFSAARSGREVLFRRLIAAAVAAVIFASLWLIVHRQLAPYYIPWTSARHGLYATFAWLGRAVAILYVVLLLARVMRMTGSSEVMRAPRWGVAIAVHSILLGVFLFALWLPGRGDLADVLLLVAFGALAVIFSGIVLALARFKRGYLVESWLALMLLWLGVGGLVFFTVLITAGRLD
jgi:hypothetical protein